MYKFFFIAAKITVKNVHNILILISFFKEGFRSTPCEYAYTTSLSENASSSLSFTQSMILGPFYDLSSRKTRMRFTFLNDLYVLALLEKITVELSIKGA